MFKKRGIMSRYTAKAKDDNQIIFGYDVALGFYFELRQKPEDPSQEVKILRRVFSVSGTPTSEISNLIEDNMIDSDKKKYKRYITRIALDLPI